MLGTFGRSKFDSFLKQDPKRFRPFPNFPENLGKHDKFRTLGAFWSPGLFPPLPPAPGKRFKMVHKGSADIELLKAPQKGV